MRRPGRIWLTCSLCALALLSNWGLRSLRHPVSARNAPQQVELESTRLSQAGGASGTTPAASSAATVPLRLSNTSRSLSELMRDDRAVLLENAVWDTRLPLDGLVPESLKAGAEPGAFIVQSRRASDASFRAILSEHQAATVSYIPNNSWLVVASAANARMLAERSEVACVLPYEPYYKLKPDLLRSLLVPDPPGGSAQVDILLFPEAAAPFQVVCNFLGIQLLAREHSRIGTIFTAQCPWKNLAALARLPHVQALQSSRVRATATDHTRAAVGVAIDTTNQSNYLDLYGANVLVGLADTGVDSTHPDLSGRLFFDATAAAIDVAGHGTHVAGVIAGSGFASVLASNVPGSVMPPDDLQFRGIAPASTLFCIGLTGTNPPSNTYLQTTAAETNVLISNNSWIYEGSQDYDFAAAGYDAAVRDALPMKSGSQSVLFVFPAGNAGQGTDNGTGGVAGAVASPATAKNVLTVGALEQARFITNSVVTCTGEDPDVSCVTNQPWLGMTDNATQAASFSSRGNVGIGFEGPFGRFKPDIMAPGTFLLSARSAQFDAAAHYGPSESGLVLSNLNESLGPFYRLDSGTSLAAGAAAGTLALIQEFFESRLSHSVTPALLKALVINGAQLDPAATLAASSQTNLLGWGALNLPSSLPPGLTNIASPTNSIFYEQETSLATGEEITWSLRILDPGLSLPLLVTLAWTDPPGNTAAAIKLVNDLDLVITNLDTGEICFGNDIPADSQWSAARDPNEDPFQDCVNNVERIRISPPLSTNYSVSVRARRVNVDCGSQRFDNAAQDFALVISSGTAAVADTLAMDSRNDALAAPSPAVTLTNSFLASNEFGTILTGQRFGSHGPAAALTPIVPLVSDPPSAISPGQYNQWRFYVITNEPGFTNAAFAIFDSAGLSPSPATAPALKADVDLYVSTDPQMLDLVPSAFSWGYRSTGPAADELIVLTDAIAVPYYIAVKCESPFGAEASLAVVFSDEPLSTVQEDGGLALHGFPSPCPIPSGEESSPGSGTVLAFPPNDFMARRVVVSNLVSHAFAGDLQTSLSHNNQTILLADFSSEPGGDLLPFVFDDSSEGDLSASIPAATPGGLSRWNGLVTSGPWIVRHNSRGAAGTNFGTVVTVHPQTNEPVTVLPGGERLEYFEAPAGVTNILVTLFIMSGDGPIWFEVAPAQMSGIGFNQAIVSEATSPMVLTLNAWSDPPVQPGLWRVRLRNEGTEEVSAQLDYTFAQDTVLDPFIRVRMGSPAPISDDALTAFSIPVTNSGAILSMEAGLRLEHPRLGDLSFTLVSPAGTRVPLQFHRGADSTNGLGCDIIVTNIFPVESSGGPHVASNTINLRKTSGTVSIQYHFYEIPDWMRIFYETNVVFDTGLISGSGTTNVAYGPGDATTLTIVMNEGDNSDPETAWYYSVRSSYPDFGFFTFSDSTAAPPVKFALPPFDYVSGEDSKLRVGPEMPLSILNGESVAGTWKLEVRDAFAGPETGLGELIEMELAFLLSDSTPQPIAVTNDAPLQVALSPLQTRWLQATTLPWTERVTNCLVQSDAPLNLLFSTNAPSDAGAPDPVVLLWNALSGCVELSPSSTPSIAPASGFYLGLQNTNAAFANAIIQIQMSPVVRQLFNAVPLAGTDLAPNACDYYTFNVSELTERLRFRVANLSGDAQLLARKGLPLPNSTNAQASSDSPGVANELILLKNSDVPLLLSPGAWYIAVTNKSGSPLSYQIEARQWMQSGEPLVITSCGILDGMFQLTWTSLPGVIYNVLSRANLQAGSEWINISGSVQAEGPATSFSVPLSSEAEFFRIAEEGSL